MWRQHSTKSPESKRGVLTNHTRHAQGGGDRRLSDCVTLSRTIITGRNSRRLDGKDPKDPAAAHQQRLSGECVFGWERTARWVRSSEPSRQYNGVRRHTYRAVGARERHLAKGRDRPVLRTRPDIQIRPDL